MDSDEIRISKIADDLLDQLNSELTSLLNLDATSTPLRNNDDQFKTCLNNIVKVIDQFQPSPQLLDYKLRYFIEKLIETYSLKCLDTNSTNQLLANAISTIFYSFSKVRGIKTVSNCLTSNIYLITFILDKLESNTWQGRFFLLVWLSILILAPFPLIKIDSKLPDTVYRISNYYLESVGKENEAAAILMARFLSRNDSATYLDLFITENFNSIAWEKKSQYNKAGTLSVLNFLLRISKRSSIIKHTSRILTLILNEIQEDTDNTNILRMHIKVLGKISLVCEAYNKYDSVEEILNILFDHIGHSNTVIRYCSAKQIAKLSKDLPFEMRYEIVIFLLNELEIRNLDLSGTSLRLQSNLIINSETVDIEKYHGVLLTLGEFARQRLLDPSSSLIYLVVSVLQQTLFLEQHRLTYTTGSNVRDSSCFVAWSLCKKYRNIELEIDILESLFKCLILTSCFDRDLMIRRASSAALQELVGRHGDPVLALLLPDSKILNNYKVKLIEILDFTVLGQRERSFQLSLEISKSIDGIMTNDFISFLISKGICNTDYDQRKYSAELLSKFISHGVQSNSNDDISKLILELLTRFKVKPENGLLYTIAEIMNCITDLNLFDSADSTFHEIFTNVKFDFHKDQFYKGEELIHLFSMLAKFGFQLNNHELDLMFNIARVGSQIQLQEKFIQLSKRLNELPAKYEDQWIYYVKNGNLIMATAIGYSGIFDKKKDDILKLIGNSKIDANLRSSLVNSFSNFLQNCSNIDDEILLQLVENLDDYTITNQGDVGSFIRLATLELIKNNKETFIESSVVFKEVEKKLIRLSCEVMDRIKYRSFKLLLILKRWESYYLEYASENHIVIDFKLNDLSFAHQRDYFTLVFKVYQHEYLRKQNKEISIELWRGISFSCGSNQASDATINVSIYSFLSFWRAISPEEQNFILMDLLDILKPIDKQSKTLDRQFKLQNSCLRFWCNLLELNISLPESFKMRNLFIRVYNSSLGTSNIPRLLSCIRIFTMMLLCDTNGFADCEKRLKWLKLKHPIPKIKQAAAEALKEIQHEKQQLEFL